MASSGHCMKVIKITREPKSFVQSSFSVFANGTLQMYTHTFHIKQIKEASEIVKQAKWDAWGIKHTALHVYEQHSRSRTPPKQVLIKQEGEVEVANARLTVPIKWEREKKAVMKRQENHRSQAGPASWNIEYSRGSLTLPTLRPETFRVSSCQVQLKELSMSFA